MCDIGIVLSTFENEDQAKKTIALLLEKKLVACAQEIPIKSHYTWKNELCHDNEILVLMKTKKNLYKTLESELLKIHPYETPEIVFIDASDTFKGYADWVLEETNR